MATAEWTVLEKLLLAQAVYKYGEDNWFQIARNLKHHALLDRPSDYFNQKVNKSKKKSIANLLGLTENTIFFKRRIVQYNII